MVFFFFLFTFLFIYTSLGALAAIVLYITLFSLFPSSQFWGAVFILPKIRKTGRRKRKRNIPLGGFRCRMFSIFLVIFQLLFFFFASSYHCLHLRQSWRESLYTLSHLLIYIGIIRCLPHPLYPTPSIFLYFPLFPSSPCLATQAPYRSRAGTKSQHHYTPSLSPSLHSLPSTSPIG